ncbi:MAG TPA: NTP transferase domain-containing protein [Phycisphaerae bacterium]|nr:NTP transferase domain-containing protein [Phycisphaerae bacterium]HRW51266.1 NTP transferase domain-containing protein [Phycisphaerae bacterium]
MNADSGQSKKENTRELAAIILAAGKSTRMKTEKPKVLHSICGRPMLGHVLGACRAAGIEKFFVIVGFAKEQIIRAYEGESGIHFVEQAEQKGTGHAVQMCADAFRGFVGDAIVIAGDMPMIRPETLRTLIQSHRAAAASASLATTILENPASYGRIVRDARGQFERIVEHRDCSPDQLDICEVNPSYYCFDAESLFDSLTKITPNNAKGEYYITDTLEILRNEGKRVQASTNVPAEDAVGINSREDLADVGKVMQRRIHQYWMSEGVTIEDPDTTRIDVDARIGCETVIRPFSYIEGAAHIGEGCVVGPYAYVRAGAVIESGAVVGPTVLGALDGVATAKRPVSPIERRQTASVVRQPPEGA